VASRSAVGLRRRVPAPVLAAPGPSPPSLPPSAPGEEPSPASSSGSSPSFADAAAAVAALGGETNDGGDSSRRRGWAASAVAWALRALRLPPQPFSSCLTDGGSLVLECMNVNFLAVFILANLLVGVVNSTLHTLDTPTLPALAVLAAYLTAVAAAAVAWRVHGVTLKFW
jgi:hypothetical protein